MANENVVARRDGAVVPFRNLKVCTSFDLYDRTTGDFLKTCNAMGHNKIVEIDLQGLYITPIEDVVLIWGAGAPAEPPTPPAPPKPKPQGLTIQGKP